MISSPLRFRRPSKQTLFVSLMVISAVLLLLPREMLGGLRWITNPLAVLQWSTSQTSRHVVDLKSLGNAAITAEEHSALVTELQAKRNLTDSLQVKVAELEAKVSELTKVRALAGFPTEGRLIPADVIGADAVASRGSLLLSKGSVSKVKSGDAVTSRLFVDAGTRDGAQKNAMVLGHEALIGWIDESEAFTSRVALLSDPYPRRTMVVNLVREQKGGPPLLLRMDDKPVKFPLQGAGAGMMKLLDVDARFVEGGYVRVGDLIMSDPNEPRLPASLVIGEITALEKDLDPKKRPLYYTAQVKHRYDPRTLGRVFIADFSRVTDSKK